MKPLDAPEKVERLRQLLSDIDRRFGEIRERNRDRMECGRGCSDCCRCRLSVTHTEAELIRRGLAELPLSTRREIAARAKCGGEMCPALDADGSCQIYAWRPLACRSYGAPLRHDYPVPLIHPSRIDVCDKNFVDIDPSSLSREDVIDQNVTSERLAAIDGNHHDRVPLAQILADAV